MSAPVTLELVMAEVRQLRALMEQMAGPPAPGADTRPLTAEDLIKRWRIAGATPAAQLHNLARKCRDRGLEPMRGTRGHTATYQLGDVLHAEAYAAGKLKRRKHGASRHGNL